MMVDGVDLDVAQARADLLPDKYDRRRISGALAIRRLSSRHYKRPMSEGNVCSGWLLLLFLVYSLHHMIYSKCWWSFKRRHWLLVCFVSLPIALCWKIGKKLFKVLAALCGALAMCFKIVYGLWLFLKWCSLSAESYGQLDNNSHDVVGSKITKELVRHVSWEMFLYSGVVWVWFGLIQLRSTQLVIRQRLMISGDVELNPGPSQQEINKILASVDNTVFDDEHWNILIIECKSFSGDWEKVSAYLGLPFKLIDIIKRDNPKDSCSCWNEALKQWIKQNYNTELFGRPSWRSLLRAVAEVDKQQFQKLAAEHQANGEKSQDSKECTEMASSEIQTSSCSDFLGVVQGASESVPVVTIAESDPLPIASFKHKEQIFERCSFESEQMMFKFQKLFTATKKSLREKKISVGELVGHLECLGSIKPTYKDIGQTPLRCQLPGLANAKTVDAVMSVVKDYCSFFNYHMLEHIIDEFGMKQDKDNMASYKEDFTKYAECCITQCPSEVGKMSAEGSANLFVTLDDLFDNCALSHLNVFIGNLRKILKIPSNVSLRLCRINLGSIKLIFQIPHSVQEAIFPLSSEQEAELSSLGVVELSCWDYQFTTQQTEERVKEPATDGDSDHPESERSVDSKNTRDAELSSMATGLAMDKPVDTFSISAESALGRSSVVTSTTAAETQFSGDLTDRELRDLEMGMRHGVAGGSTKNELHLASARGYLNKVKELVEEKQFNPLWKEGELGANVLHNAAEFGQLQVLRYFIEQRGCNPASQDNRGDTPLHYAAFGKHFVIVRYLIAEQQMDPLCRAHDGTTPLHNASQAGNINIVRYLVNELRKFLPLEDIVTSRGIGGLAPTHCAALAGHLDIVKYFIAELNCDPNIATPVEYQGRTTGAGGRMALHCAAQGGHLHLVKYLVEQCNCDPSHLDSERVTPLYIAAQHGHFEVVQYLTLEQQCDPLCVDKKNNTALHLAALRGHLQIVKFFIEVLYFPLDVRGWRNETPLDKAHRRDHHHVVQYLESICPKFK